MKKIGEGVCGDVFLKDNIAIKSIPLKKINDKDPMVRVNKIKSYLEKVGEIRGTSVQVLFNNYIN